MTIFLVALFSSMFGTAVGWILRDVQHHRFDGSALRGLFDSMGRN